MTDFEEDFHAAQRALMRLRDAFEELEGTPANSSLKEALRIAEQLRTPFKGRGMDAPVPRSFSNGPWDRTLASV